MQDLAEKMVFVSGPRQVGKTTLARAMLTGEHDRYYNWDRREDRKSLLAARWPAERCTIVIDELHKYRPWRNWIKGEYDTHKGSVRFLVTGSARLDVYRRGGDSLEEARGTLVLKQLVDRFTLNQHPLLSPPVGENSPTLTSWPTN